jgi:hypothetical protein
MLEDEDVEAISFKVKITAVGEVRDKDGNLISSEPIEIEQVMTEDELKASGLINPEEK